MRVTARPRPVGAVALHKLLERQLARHFGSLDRVPADLQPLLALVDRSYREADEDRALVERSLELASHEMLQRNDELRKELENRAYTESLRGAILESALDCIILMDGRGIVVEFNPASQRTFGFTREQAVGKPLADLIIPEKLRAAHKRGLQRYLESGEGPVLHRRIEITGQRADGTEIPVELAIVPFKASGQPMFAGYVRDLTDRDRADKEILRRTATIQLLQQVPFLANEAETVEEATRTCLEKVCEYTGWPVGHAYFMDESRGALVSRGVWQLPQGKGFDAFRRVTEATALPRGTGLPGRVWQTRRAAWIPDVLADSNFSRARMAEDIGVHAAFAFPVLVQGDVFAVLEFFSDAIRGPDAELLDVMANIGEQLGRVFERRRAAADLKAAYGRLQEVDRTRIQFLNTAAHELGTPLTPMRIQIGLLKSRLGPRTAPEERKTLEILDRNVERMARLVGDLLDSARLQTGNLRNVPKPMDLAAVARAAVEAYQDMANAARIALACKTDGAQPCVADPARIGQAIDNLLSNALKFTPAGGQVEVAVHAAGSDARLAVRDTGIGMREEAIPKLFQPFSQVHDTMQITQPGSGLGLYISRGILTANGGRIGAESPGLGKGSTFWFTLPRRGVPDLPDTPKAHRRRSGQALNKFTSGQNQLPSPAKAAFRWRAAAAAAGDPHGHDLHDPHHDEDPPARLGEDVRMRLHAARLQQGRVRRDAEHPPEGHAQHRPAQPGRRHRGLQACPHLKADGTPFPLPPFHPIALMAAGSAPARAWPRRSGSPS
jgi:PAS domain S-box-containing protein